MPEPAFAACLPFPHLCLMHRYRNLAELNPGRSFDTDLSRQKAAVQNVQDQTTQDLLYDLIDLWKRHYSYAGLGY